MSYIGIQYIRYSYPSLTFSYILKKDNGLSAADLGLDWKNVPTGIQLNLLKQVIVKSIEVCAFKLPDSIEIWPVWWLSLSTSQLFLL